jgi:hypothetical protein
MTAPALKQIAKEAGMKLKGSKKDDLVASLQKSWPFLSTLHAFIGDPSPKRWFFFFFFFLHQGTLPPFHSFYAENFNYIDRFNRYFYQILSPHKSMSSGCVRVWSLLNIAFVQSWAFYCEVTSFDPEKLTLRDYTKLYLKAQLAMYKK